MASEIDETELNCTVLFNSQLMVFQGVTLSHRVHMAQIPEASLGKTHSSSYGFWAVAFILKQTEHTYVYMIHAYLCRYIWMNF